MARMTAAQWHKNVVLKGAFTVIANPDGYARINPFANPGLASGGTGDVLAGVIAGLAAQGVPQFNAAVGGVYLHAIAGERIKSRLNIFRSVIS
jgi:NAD(P)H-hydrate epimerase